MTDPKNLQYTAEHEWLDIDGSIAIIGITAYAAEQLGDVVYVDLPEVGSTVAIGRVVGEIESTKSVGELFAPVDGTVTEVNQAVVDEPSLVNDDAFAAWLIKVEFESLPEGLLDLDGYTALTQ